MPRTCYYCGAPETSREHVPPKLLFKSFNDPSVQRLTVPSCDLHNSTKSEDDNAISKAMLMTLASTRVRWPCSQGVADAISKAEPHFEQVKRSVKLGSILKNPPKGFEMPMAILLPHVDISAWVRQIAAGLAWAAGKERGCEDWDNAGVVLPDHVPGQEARDSSELLELLKAKRELREGLECLPWTPGWWPMPPSAMKEAFTFDYCGTRADSLQVVWFRLRFFNSFGCYVFFRPTESVAAAITEWLNVTDDEGSLTTA